MTATEQGPAPVAGNNRPAPVAGPVLSFLMNLTRLVDKASYGVIVFAMGVMTLLISVQVVVRYVFGSSIDSADELARVFFIWCMFLAIPHGIKIGIHVSIDVLVSRLRKSRQDLVFRLMNAGAALLMLIVFFMTILVATEKWQELLPTIAVTSAVFYIAVLISAGHSFMHLVVLVIGGPTAWASQTEGQKS